MERQDQKAVIELWRVGELTKPQNDPAQDIEFARRRTTLMFSSAHSNSA